MDGNGRVRADRGAEPALDAFGGVVFDHAARLTLPVGQVVTVIGVLGTEFHAQRILALHADERIFQALEFVTDHADSRFLGIAFAELAQ